MQCEASFSVALGFISCRIYNGLQELVKQKPALKFILKRQIDYCYRDSAVSKEAKAVGLWLLKKLL
jgi:hypothetical protein